VAYAITARNIDPLYAISLADRRNLKVLSAIDGLSGDMSVFRLIGDKKFLIGIGRDGTNTCQGFQTRARWPGVNQVAVSIIDVRDLARIRLVQRQCVAIDNAVWSGSAVQWDLDQAHKMIGMHSDGTSTCSPCPSTTTPRPTTGLVVVPLPDRRRLDVLGSQPLRRSKRSASRR
jgi:hypothetical protein